MSSTVEQIKARLSIVEVVSGYLKLEKTGANYRARCPFHQEKTPSFFVSPGRGSYHCFGCNRGGDLISFVQELENLDFIGALKLLAERAGVEYRRPDPRLANERERLYSLLEAATRYYIEQLSGYVAGQTYLKERGLTEKSIKSFRLGFAPAGWRNVGPPLIRQGFKEAELIQVGLLVAAPGKNAYDRFRSRIMFPLADNAGRVIGFSARIFGDAAAAGAKYINSPGTPLYDKSRFLYLYDRARLSLRRADRCILVEGQIDALLSHQAGLEETVAVSGTALTAGHLNLIKRLTKNLIMAFDADLAGVKAGQRAIGLALNLGLEVKIAALPPGRDPADLIREQPSLWRAAVEQATHVIDFLLAMLKRQTLDRRELAHAIEREVYPFLVRLANPLDQAYFINQISVLLALPESVIREGVTKTPIEIQSATEAKIETATARAPTTRRERLEEIILGSIFWRPDASWSAAVRARLGEKSFNELLTSFEARRDELALAAELTYSGSAELAAELSQLLDYWQAEMWREELSSLLAKVKQLGGSSPEIISPYLVRCQELSEKINSFKKL